MQLCFLDAYFYAQSIQIFSIPFNLGCQSFSQLLVTSFRSLKPYYKRFQLLTSSDLQLTREKSMLQRSVNQQMVTSIYMAYWYAIQQLTIKKKKKRKSEQFALSLKKHQITISELLSKINSKDSYLLLSINQTKEVTGEYVQDQKQGCVIRTGKEQKLRRLRRIQASPS